MIQAEPLDCFLHLRQHASNASDCTLKIRRHLPTYNDPSHQTTKRSSCRTTIRNTASNTAWNHSTLITATQRPLLIIRTHIHDQRPRLLPSPVLLPQPSPQLDPRLPRRQNPPTPRQNHAILQMGRCAHDPRIRALPGRHVHVDRRAAGNHGQRANFPTTPA